MSSMRIRRATRRDWEGILRLIREYPDKLMQNHLPRASRFFVVVEKDKIVGCCALEVYSKRLAEIRSLAVAREFQGKGIATRLIERCLKLAKQKAVYEILSITGAIALFEKKGFKAFNKERFALLKVLE